jgi:hypothetical protein
MLDSEQLDLLSQGINLFNQGEFFESHEFFEALWQSADEEHLQQQFLFLVRIAAAGVHLTNTNYSSLFLLGQALKQLDKGLQITIINHTNIQYDLQNLIKRLQKTVRADLPIIAKKLELKLELADL